MSIVTLTSDWGIRDYYVAALKGELLSLCEGVQIVDVSHEVAPFDVMEASYILSNCYDKFPAGTIHFIAMRGKKHPDYHPSDNGVFGGYLLVKCKGYYFIGYDSGTFYLTLGEEEKEIYRLDISAGTPLYIANRHLCNVIAAMLKGAPAETLGTPASELFKIYNAQPTSDQSVIRGNVIHVDNFHNVVSNITKEVFEKVGSNRSFTLSMRNYNQRMRSLNKNYDETDESELVVLFNEKGNLVIALNRSKAASLMGLKLFDTIRIEFEES